MELKFNLKPFYMQLKSNLKLNNLPENCSTTWIRIRIQKLKELLSKSRNSSHLIRF